MNAEPAPRSSRLGGLLVAALVVGSAAGVIGWYVMTNRTGIAIDARGFDLNVTPSTSRPAPGIASLAAPRPAESSLGMVKADAGVRIADSNAPSAPDAGRAAAGDKKEQARANFITTARQHESDVRRFGERMTRKYPVIRQYGKDWMSHPDLRALTDNYWRNHDPVAFLFGLAKAPSLGVMVKQYAGSPEIREFVVEGMKEAPGALTSSALDVLSNDGVVKGLVANVARGIGLPPSVTGLIAGSGDPSQVDQTKIMKDVMSSPALQPRGDPAPPVALPSQP